MATMTSHRSSSPLATCLADAQADAERFYGKAPAAPWTSSASRRGTWAAGLGAVALVALIAVMAHRDPAPAPAAKVVAPVAAPRAFGSAGLSPFAPAGSFAAAEESVADEGGATLRPTLPETVGAGCGAAGCAGATPMIAIAPEVVASEDWALRPDPVPSAAAPSFTGLVNVPPVPDEQDTTPVQAAADSAPAEAAAADDSASEEKSTGGGFVLADTPNDAEVPATAARADGAEAPDEAR